MLPTLSRESPIAVIGGGAAGISAAHFLRRAGYRRVTVFESESRLGGKCCTIRAGERTFEMGAMSVFPWSHRLATQLAREFGAATEPMRRWGTTGMYAMKPPRKIPLTREEKWRAVRALLRFHRLQRSYPVAGDVGFARTPPELAEPFGAWLRRHRLEALAPGFAVFMTGPHVEPVCRHAQALVQRHF